MKYIMAQPSVFRFEWELQIAIHNMLKVGIKKKDIIILFSRHQDKVADEIKKLGVNVHVYQDERQYTNYIPSLKPHLMYRYLKEDSTREQETYFFMDSDVIFREKVKTPRFKKDSKVWYGSDCNGYLNYDYIMSCKQGAKLLDGMCSIVGITEEQVKSINENSIGGQYILKNPTAEYFKKVWKDSEYIYKYYENIDTDLQKWTAEMWATLWNMLYFGFEPKVSPELSFSWATDVIESWDYHKIYHNAGVVDALQGMFFKGQYTDRSPFDEVHDYVDKQYNSYNYVKELYETKNWLEKNYK